MVTRRWMKPCGTLALFLAALFSASLAMAGDAHIARITILYDAFGKSSAMTRDWGAAVSLPDDLLLHRFEAALQGKVPSSAATAPPLPRPDVDEIVACGTIIPIHPRVPLRT